MKGPLLTMCSRSVSSIVVILALAALCFSVGEGLRLRPFPALEKVQLDATDGSFVDRSSRLTVFKSGPLDVPTQLQKRSKRFAVDALGPAYRYSNKPSMRLYGCAEQQPITVASIILVSFPSDRAPPLNS